MRFWFRNTQGTFADGVDGVFFYIFWVSAIFFAILMGLMVYFGLKYRRIEGKPAEPSASHNTMLELSWSVIPTILMAIMFVWGFKEYIVMRVAPGDAFRNRQSEMHRKVVVGVMRRHDRLSGGGRKSGGDGIVHHLDLTLRERGIGAVERRIAWVDLRQRVGDPAKP